MVVLEGSWESSSDSGGDSDGVGGRCRNRWSSKNMILVAHVMAKAVKQDSSYGLLRHLHYRPRIRSHVLPAH